MEHLICTGRHPSLANRPAGRAKVSLVGRLPAPLRIVARGAITAALLLVATATTARAADDIGDVMPITLPALRPELKPVADRLYDALMRQAHHLLGTVHEWDKANSMKLQAGVRRVVAHEAGRFVDATPPHGMNRDAKAEENAWNSRIFSAAVLLMPNDARRKAWEQAFVRWAISSYMRPSDVHCRQSVDGRTVADWFTGACIFEDYTCENLKWMATPDGGYIYPSGQDWALFRNPQKAHLHLLMAAFEGDADGWSLARNGWDAMEKMQARTADGRVFLPGEYHFPSTQHDTIAVFGLEWLYLHVADPIRDEPTQRLGTRRLKSGGLVLHRTPNVFVTLSYGAKVMAQAAAMRPDRIVSPDQRSLIGSVYIAGEERPPNPNVSAVDVDVKDDRFTAKLCVDHGPSVRANLIFRTDPDGTLYVREELVAVKDVTTARVATGMIGVLNNRQWIYETGQRMLTLDDAPTVIPAHSGKTLAAEANHIVIDDAMTITSDAPVRVHYVASSGPKRGRATDRLYLNYAEGKKTWKAGETIRRYGVAIRVGG